MNTKIPTGAWLVLVSLAVATSWGAKEPNSPESAQSCRTPQSTPDPNQQNEGIDPVDAVLKELNKQTAKLKSYEGSVEYKFIQPLLESQALRKGVLYFAKFGEKSKLRINFQTLQQDDQEEQKYIEHFIFDGTWLTQIDYQIKAAKRYQLAEPNEPTNAFDLASRNLPIVGFSKVEDLKRQFEIRLVKQERDEPNGFIQLHLDVKPDSVHEDNYIYVDFWIDKKLGLPAKVVAVSTEEDIYEIKLLRPKLNKEIDSRVFDFQIPEGFPEPEIVPLKKKGN